MSLSFQDKRILANGSVIFYHEGTLDTGSPFYLLTLVEGKQVPRYLEIIGREENLRIISLEKYARILSCDTGSLDEVTIEGIIQKKLT